MGYQTLPEILEVFAEKLVSNLMSSADSTKEEHRRIVDVSLDTLSSYLNNTVACR